MDQEIRLRPLALPKVIQKRVFQGLDCALCRRLSGVLFGGIPTVDQLRGWQKQILRREDFKYNGQFFHIHCLRLYPVLFCLHANQAHGLTERHTLSGKVWRALCRAEIRIKMDCELLFRVYNSETYFPLHCFQRLPSSCPANSSSLSLKSDVLDLHWDCEPQTEQIDA